MSNCNDLTRTALTKLSIYEMPWRGVEQLARTFASPLQPGFRSERDGDTSIHTAFPATDRSRYPSSFVLKPESNWGHGSINSTVI